MKQIYNKKYTIKKVILTFILIITIVLPCFANWIELETKLYVNSDSIVETRLSGISDTLIFKEVWAKLLNPGHWELKNGQKIWFSKDYFIIDCSSKRLKLISISLYNLQGNIIDSHSITNVNAIYDRNSFDIVVPDSYGETIVDFVCSYPVDYSSRKSVKVDPYIFERPYHY